MSYTDCFHLVELPRFKTQQAGEIVVVVVVVVVFVWRL